MLRIRGLVYGRNTTFTVDIDPNERVPALWDACEKKLAGYMGEYDLEVIRARQWSTNGWLQTDSALFKRLKACDRGALTDLLNIGGSRMNRRSTMKDLGFPEKRNSKKNDVHVVAIVVDRERLSKAITPTETKPMLQIRGFVYGRNTTFTVDIDPNERTPALWDACEKKLADYIGEDDLEVIRACQNSTNGWLQTDSALFERLKAREFSALTELVENGAGRMNQRSTMKDLGFPEISKSKKKDVHVVAVVVNWEEKTLTEAKTVAAGSVTPKSSSTTPWLKRFASTLSRLLPGRSRRHGKKNYR